MAGVAELRGSGWGRGEAETVSPAEEMGVSRWLQFLLCTPSLGPVASTQHPAPTPCSCPHQFHNRRPLSHRGSRSLSVFYRDRETRDSRSGCRWRPCVASSRRGGAGLPRSGDGSGLPRSGARGRRRPALPRPRRLVLSLPSPASLALKSDLCVHRAAMQATRVT